MTSKRDKIVQEVRDRLSEVAYLTEIPISKRSDSESDRLSEIYEENHVKFNERFSAIAELSLFEMEDFESPIMRWETVYQDSHCKPPLITNTTHTLPELETLANQLASAVTTTGGVLEEIASVRQDFQDSLEYVYATFRVLCGFAKASKADDLVLAQLPLEILQKGRAVEKYLAIFTQREKTLKTTKEIVSQLISTNEDGPRSLRVVESRQPSTPSSGISSGISSRRK